jgi:DNA-binding transcriptional regulator YhcF (GntR family)
VILHIDTASAVPPYDQIRAQITSLSLSGALPKGTRLPSIRQLAGDLDLAPGTVARAYRELERAGVVATRGRHGTRVARREDTVDSPGHPAHLAEAASEYAVAATRAGASPDQAVAALRDAFDQMIPSAATSAVTEPPTQGVSSQGPTLGALTRGAGVRPGAAGASGVKP